MIKNKKSFITILAIISMLIAHTIGHTSFAYADSLSDDVFIISNPVTNAQVATDRNGKILVKSIDANNEYLNTIRDILTEKVAYIIKAYEGEEKVRITNTYGEDTFSYLEPSHRYEVYDLNGNKIDIVVDEFANLSAVKDKIIYSTYEKSFIYDTKTGTSSELGDYRAVSKCGNVILAYSYDSDKTGILVLDDNLNQIKKIDGYLYFYSSRIGDKEIEKIRKPIGNDQYVYNFLTEDGDILLPNDIENMPKYDSQEVIDLIYGNTIVKYDLIKKQYVSSPSEISNEEKKKIIDREEPTDQENEEMKEKIRQSLSKYEDAYVYENTYNDKKIYIASYDGHYVTATGSDADQTYTYDDYVQKYNVYDKDGNLYVEAVENLMTSLTNYGYIGVNGIIYDFDMNEVMRYPKTVNFTDENIDGKVYFLDKWTDNYEVRKSMTLYDEKFGIVKADIEDFAYMSNNGLIFMTDDQSTKLYNKNFELIKDLGLKARVNYNYTDSKYCLVDMKTGRYMVVNNEGDILVSGLKYIGRMEDDYIVYQNGFRYGIMDYNGVEVISLSIFDTIKEDANLSDYNSYDIIED